MIKSIRTMARSTVLTKEEISNIRFLTVNSITLYRLIAAPLLVLLLLLGHPVLFAWLLPLSFFTDLVDGAIARRWKVSSVLGSRIDSVADDLTILAGIAGVFILKPGFVRDNVTIVVTLIVLLVVQNGLALIRYKKLSSFHTYLAKMAAIVQGSFLILLFLLPEVIYPLFYAAALLSALDLVEEIVLTLLLSKWETDVKGLFWVMRRRQRNTGPVMHSHN